LPTESTLTLRSLPYLNQISLIESISRVLPYGVQLVVREHPSWRSHFPFKFLLELKKLSNVRLVSPKIPIHEIVENSIGVVTYNSTTGIEALMYGKPVLSFSPNVYYKLHPAAYFCANLYNLGAALTALINTKVLSRDTIIYIKKLFSISSDIQLGSDFFYNDNDAIAKSKKFSRHLAKAINWCEST